MKQIILLLIGLFANFAAAEEYDPCCSLPCKNSGICYPRSRGVYVCDCKGTGYYGKNCENAYLTTTLGNLITPDKSTTTWLLSNFQPVWFIVNNIGFLRRFLMRKVLEVRIGYVPEPTAFTALDTYSTWETYSNTTMYARTLPAIPKNCPTPMGVKGKKVLPDPDLLVEKFIKRRKFEPCPVRTSLIFAYFAQHFTHQFFKSNLSLGMPYQWGNQDVDLSQVYGQEKARQLKLRLMKDGKMKYSIINGEMYPPHIKDADVFMFGIDKVPKGYDFAIGHPGFAILPFYLFFSTLWLREHNRVCDVLKQENPMWNDERLFQTARLVIIAETIKIVIEDYVQHLSGFHFKLLYDPTLLHGQGFSYHNQIHAEFALLYHWHGLMPDSIKIKDKAYSMRQLLFNPKPQIDAGMETMIDELTNQFAGRAAGGRSQGFATLAVEKEAILDGRRLRLQPFNKYREKFGMEPYKSFTDLTGETEMAAELKKLYEDIDAVEYFIGIMVEKRREPQLFGETLTEIGSPYSLKGLLGNPIGSPSWWKQSTFGGQKLFDTIAATSLQELVCRNVKGCPKVSFKVPDGVEFKPINSSPQSPPSASEILLKIEKGKKVDDGLDGSEPEPASQSSSKKDEADEQRQSKSEL